MAGWFEDLEGRGRAGGGLALAVSLVAIAAAVALIAYPIVEGWGRWQSAGLQFTGAMLLVVGLPGLFFAARLLTGPIYPSASSVFPSLDRDALVAALHGRTEDICVCTRCRVVIPADFSTGACPVCTSAVDYQDVRSDEDVALVIAAL